MNHRVKEEPDSLGGVIEPEWGQWDREKARDPERSKRAREETYTRKSAREQARIQRAKRRSQIIR